MSSNDCGCGITKASNGDYIIVGNSNQSNSTSSWICLLRVDQTGNVKWAKQYSSTDSQRPYLWGNSPMILPDGNLILQGILGTASTTNTSGFIIKADSNGAVLWSKTYGGSTTNFWYDFCRDSDGGLVVAGSTTNLRLKGGYDCLFLKTSEDGSAYSIGTMSLSVNSLANNAVNANFSSTSHTLTVQSGQFLRSGNAAFIQGPTNLSDTTKVLYIKDVPNDNGKNVFVRWTTTASPISLGITGFDLYRYDQNAWTYIKGNIPVLNDTVYQVIAHTLYDSTVIDGMHWYRRFSKSSHARPIPLSILSSDRTADIPLIIFFLYHRSTEALLIQMEAQPYDGILSLIPIAVSWVIMSTGKQHPHLSRQLKIKLRLSSILFMSIILHKRQRFIISWHQSIFQAT